MIILNYYALHAHTLPAGPERDKEKKKNRQPPTMTKKKETKKKKKNRKIGQLPRHREQLTEASVMRSDSSANGIFYGSLTVFLMTMTFFSCNIKE